MVNTDNGWGIRNNNISNIIWYKNYDETTPNRRKFLIKKILEFNPKSVLELGACAGCNLQFLKNYDLEIVGLEANKYAIDYGRKTKSFANFVEQDITKNWNIGKKFDIIFSSGVLMHIHPFKIMFVLSEIVKYTNIGGIFIEDFIEIEKDNSKFKADGFRGSYNYINRFKSIKQSLNINVNDLPIDCERHKIADCNLKLITMKISL